MSYEVIVLGRAELDLNRNAIWWAEHRDVDQALRWLDGFTAAIDTLASNPQRHALVREDDLFPFPVRQLVFGIGSKPTHRAVFSVEGEKVLVYTAGHLAQDDLTPDDIG